MKKIKSSLALLLAIMMLISIAPINATAATSITPSGFKVKNAVDGEVYGSYAELVWDEASLSDRAEVQGIQVFMSKDNRSWTSILKNEYSLSQTSYSYNFSDSDFGKAIYFTASYFDKSGGSGAKCASVKVVPYKKYVPQPSGFKATNAKNGACDTKVALKWNALSEKDLKYTKSYSYRIQYSADKSSWKTVVEDDKTSTDACTYTFKFSNKDDIRKYYGKTLYFRLQFFVDTSKKTSDVISVKYTNSDYAKYAGSAGDVETIYKNLIKYKKNKLISTKGTKYNKKDLKKGSKVVYNTKFYTVTITVTKITKKHGNTYVDYKYSVKSKYKVGGKELFGFKDRNDDKFYSSGKSKFTLPKGAAGLYGLETTVYFNGDALYDVARETMDTATLKKYIKKDKFSSATHALFFTKSLAKDYYEFDLRIVDGDIKEKSINLGKALNYYSEGNCGTIVSYRQKGTKKWKKKSFKAGKAMLVKKLKPATAYEFKCQYYFSDKDPFTGKTVKVVTGSYPKTYTRWTATKAPKIKSIKISGMKNAIYHKSGYWYWSANRLTYAPPRDIKDVAYTVTLTVSDVPKEAKGIGVKVKTSYGVEIIRLKGRKTKYTFTVQEARSAKGKTRTLNVCSYSNEELQGPGDYAKKDFKVK